MKLLRGLIPHPVLHEGTAATIGNFDGVHLGHQALLRALKIKANQMGLPVLVTIFEPQPGEYFNSEKAPARLTSLREKLYQFEQLGVDYVYCLRFDKNLASMPADFFAKHVIFSLLRAKYLLIGEDFHFGKDRLGDVHLLKTKYTMHSCAIDTFPNFFVQNERVSSTGIREYLNLGALQQAAHFLGRAYSLCGHVVQGDARARQWGFPTANIHLPHKKLALHGVYCVQVIRIHGGISTGIANVGCRPTVDGLKTVLEVHLFDTDESLYGELLQVVFLHPLRAERRFPSVDALVAQIKQDIMDAKNWFMGCPSL